MKKDIEILNDFMDELMPNASRKAVVLLSPTHIDMERIRAARKAINKIIDQLGSSSLIFRGESKDYGKITSGLYRQYCMPRDGQESLIDAESFSSFKEMVSNIEEDERDLSKETSTLGGLTDLQQQGGKTALIDFTKDIHIALYFACNDHPDEDGQLIILDKSVLKNLDQEKIDQKLEKNASDQKEIYLVDPVSSDARAVFQSNVFLCPTFGYLTAENDAKAFTIEAKLKIGILEYLDKFHGINEETIFPDLPGFKRRDGGSYAAFYQGLTLQNRGESENAIASYDRVLEIKPKFAGAYTNRGNMKAALGRHEEAIKDYDKALEFNKKYVEAYSNRGNVKAALGRHEEAIEDYSSALEINSEYASAYFNRGKAKFALEKYAEAIEDYDQALEINPEDADACFNRGGAKVILGRHEEAIEDYNRTLEINPKDASAYGNRGYLKGILGKYEEAIEDYNRRLEINPKDASTYGNRGYLKGILGKYEEAIEDYGRVLEINSEDAFAYLYRGSSKGTLGRDEEAMEDLNQALSLFQQQGNEERIKEVEALLRRFEGDLRDSLTEK